MTREESTLSTHLERARIHLLELLVQVVELNLGARVVTDSHGDLLDALLEPSDLCFGTGDNEVDSVDVGGLRLAGDEVDIDVVGDLDVALGDGLQEGGLSGAVLAEETVTLAVVEGDLGALDEEATMEGERELVDLDVAALRVGDEHTSGGPLGGDAELRHRGEVVRGVVGGGDCWARRRGTRRGNGGGRAIPLALGGLLGCLFCETLLLRRRGSHSECRGRYDR